MNANHQRTQLAFIQKGHLYTFTCLRSVLTLLLFIIVLIVLTIDRIIIGFKQWAWEWMDKCSPVSFPEILMQSNFCHASKQVNQNWVLITYYSSQINNPFICLLFALPCFTYYFSHSWNHFTKKLHLLNFILAWRKPGYLYHYRTK